MKLLERAGDRWRFRLGEREKVMLERLLAFFPLQPRPSPKLSRGVVLEEATALLEESLREQRSELTGWIANRLVEGAALQSEAGAWLLVLEAGEPDRLLQILNELRVSAWHKLGCPENLDDEALAQTSGNASLFLIMTLAGQFEMVLLSAVLGEEEPGAAA